MTEMPEGATPATTAGRSGRDLPTAVAVGAGLSQVLINRFAARRWSTFTGEGQSSRPVNLRL